MKNIFRLLFVSFPLLLVSAMADRFYVTIAFSEVALPLGDNNTDVINHALPGAVNS